MLKRLLLAASLGLMSVHVAQASSIDISTRASVAGSFPDAASYQSYINGLDANPATAGYGDASLSSYNNVSNQTVFGGSNGDIAFRFTVDFGVTAAEAGPWNFRFGVDFGRGGAVFIDGVAVATNPNDMWWAGSYANASQAFELSSLLTTGNHVIQVYGLESCCDGTQQGQFQAPGGSFMTFGSGDSLGPVAVPEPASFLLFGAALAGLGSLRLAGSHKSA